MANLGFSLRSTFGLLPKTEKIEGTRKTLEDEFIKLKEYLDSEELLEYKELKELIDSDTFKNNKKEILSLNFKNTEEFKKEQNYIKLKKNKRIINFYKVLNSQEYKEFIETEESNNLKEYLELEGYLKSDVHSNIIQEFKTNLTSEKNKEKEFKGLEKSRPIKDYFKVLNSEKLKLHNELVDSEELVEYIELEKFSGSQQLQEFKNALTQQLLVEKGKKKELKQLKKSPEIKAYNKLKNKDEVDKPS